MYEMLVLLDPKEGYLGKGWYHKYISENTNCSRLNRKSEWDVYWSYLIWSRFEWL